MCLAIRAKTPSGDILPGVTDEEMLGVPYSVLDRILLGLQRKLAETDIACSLEIGLETVRRVAALSPVRVQPGRCPLPGSGD